MRHEFKNSETSSIIDTKCISSLLNEKTHKFRTLKRFLIQVWNFLLWTSHCFDMIDLCFKGTSRVFLFQFKFLIERKILYDFYEEFILIVSTRYFNFYNYKNRTKIFFEILMIIFLSFAKSQRKIKNWKDIFIDHVISTLFFSFPHLFLLKSYFHCFETKDFTYIWIFWKKKKNGINFYEIMAKSFWFDRI